MQKVKEEIAKPFFMTNIYLIIFVKSVYFFKVNLKYISFFICDIIFITILRIFLLISVI